MWSRSITESSSEKGFGSYKTLLPYEPTEVLDALASGVSKNPNANISSIHFFPLGGIKTNAEWISNNLTKNIKSA